MPFVAITYTVPRPNKPAIDFVHLTGGDALNFLRSFKDAIGCEPREQTEYKELGLRVDRIERE